MPPYFQFTFDGMRTLFMAISNTLHRGVDKSDIKGENLRKDIFDLKFEGISGPIGFDENGDRLSPYAIMNNQVTSRRLLSTTHPRSRQLSGTPTFVNLGVYDGSSDSITLTNPFDLPMVQPRRLQTGQRPALKEMNTRLQRGNVSLVREACTTQRLTQTVEIVR